MLSELPKGIVDLVGLSALPQYRQRPYKVPKRDDSVGCRRNRSRGQTKKKLTKWKVGKVPPSASKKEKTRKAICPLVSAIEPRQRLNTWGSIPPPSLSAVDSDRYCR